MGQAGKITLKVKGMHCDGCESRVKNVLSKMQGVTRAEASHKTGEVEVRVTPAASEEVIKEKVEGLGYEVV
jgi:copper chaperone CopZ